MMHPTIKLAVPNRPLTRRLIATGKIAVDYLETTGPRADTAIGALPEQPCLLHNSVWNWSLAHPAALEQQNGSFAGLSTWCIPRKTSIFRTGDHGFLGCVLNRYSEITECP